MEEEKIDRILKLVDMLEVTDENRDDIAKVKKLIEQKKYAEMLEVLKKVTSKNETKIKEDNRTILFRNEEKEENKEVNIWKPWFSHRFCRVVLAGAAGTQYCGCQCSQGCIVPDIGDHDACGNGSI